LAANRDDPKQAASANQFDLAYTDCKKGLELVPISRNERSAEPVSQRQRASVSQRYSAVGGFEATDCTPKLRVHVISLLDSKDDQVGNG
jgi:hypothetical protein